MFSNQKVIIALSGGVDSAVAAYLLQQTGYQLQAVYMRNWDSGLNDDLMGHKKPKKGCTDQDDLLMVKKICQQLRIPLKIYNFVAEYWDLVFEPSLKLLTDAQTPNPDVLCNQRIKFGHLIKMIKVDFGPDVLIATGHYAGVSKVDEQYYLMTAKDHRKDQTYFLNQLNQTQLSQIIFPLADISDKKIVRKIAAKANLPVWDKPDSTGICFIGERNYQKFLTNYLPIKPGPIVNVVNQKVIGEHQGLAFYTIFQRKGLKLSGQDQPMFVCDKDQSTNTIYVCPKELVFRYIYQNQTKVIDPHWINQPLKVGCQLYLRYRHTGALVLATIEQISDDQVIFSHELTQTTAPGQYVVFYNLAQTVCYGGGIFQQAPRKWK